MKARGTSILLSTIAICLVGILPPAARADNFNFNYVQGDTSGIATATSAVITTAPTATPGVEQITAITGTYSIYLGGTPATDNIVGLFTPDTSYQADDLLYLNGGPYLDEFGLTFTLQNFAGDDLGHHVNIAYDTSPSPGYYEPVEFAQGPGTLTLNSTAPEPASFGLVALAACALIVSYRRRCRA
jgi:hypothetical protein